MRFSGLFSALGLSSAAIVSAIALSGCLGGDDTSVAPPPAADAGADATTAKDSGSTVVKDSGEQEDASGSDAEADAG